MNVNKLIEIFKEEYKEITALNETMMCFVDINEIKCLTDEIERLNNIINGYEKDIEILMNIIDKNDIEVLPRECDVWEKWYFKLKELKKGDTNER